MKKKITRIESVRERGKKMEESVEKKFVDCGGLIWGWLIGAQEGYMSKDVNDGEDDSNNRR